MSERKVLNKYFPPDFDPKKISALRERKQGGIKTGPKQQVVRLMAPFSMRCNTCGEYIYKGKKFNARKETAKGEQYYGIKIFRFYIKCTQCSAEITFKTDPKNTDYVAEHGAQRNFEVWRTDGTEGDAEETAEERLDRIEREMADDPMAELEAKQVDSKREMDILDALQEIRTRNARMERADADEVLNRVAARAAQEGVDVPVGATEEELRRMLEAEEDEAEVRRVFGRLKSDAALPAVKALPAIELNEPLEDEEVDQEGEAGPVASGSGTSASVPAASSIAKGDEALAMPPPPVPKVPTVKRKLAEVEPDALSLLSEDARKFASSVTFGAAKPKAPIKTGLVGLVAPPKKKLNAGSKFGIAPKAKPKA